MNDRVVTTEQTGASTLAPAKVNLFLHVTGRRDDGYHLLQSLFVFADVGDVIGLCPASTNSLEITGPFADELSAATPDPTANIVWKAVQAMRASLLASSGADCPEFALTLEKNLPVAAGLGGGSADAAAALRLMQALCGQHLPPRALRSLALELGADVPACLDSRASWVEGIGESILPLPDFPTVHAVLVNPGIKVSTADIFRRRTAMSSGYSTPISPWAGQDADELLGFLATVGNDLEAAAIDAAPAIAGVLKKIRTQVGCKLARMSGSGATCFGLFADAADAARAAASIARGHPDWWVVAAKLN